MLEPLKDGENKEYLTKSLFNKFVFNTAITRAKSLVVAVGKPLELLDFEDKHLNAEDEIKCWHEYLHLCLVRHTVKNLSQPQINEEVIKRLTAHKRYYNNIEALIIYC